LFLFSQKNILGCGHQNINFLKSLKTVRSIESKQDMPLNKRIFSCSSCGMSIDRDLNASKNIVAAGMSILKLVDGNDIGLPDEAIIGGF